MDRDRTGLELEAFERLRGEFEATGAVAEDLTGGLDEGPLWWKPEAGRWSAGECVQHLVLANEIYLEVFDEVIGKAWQKGRTGSGPFERSLLGRWVPRFLEPPARIPIPAPRIIKPHNRAVDPVAGGEDPLQRFLGQREAFTRRMQEAEGLDLGRIKVTSPFVPLLRVDLLSAFHVVVAHERRHLWQARQVIGHEEFPLE